MKRGNLLIDILVPAWIICSLLMIWCETYRLQLFFTGVIVFIILMFISWAMIQEEKSEKAEKEEENKDKGKMIYCSNCGACLSV